MRRSRLGRRLALSVAVLACAASVVPLASRAATSKGEKAGTGGPPIVSTGNVSHVRGSSAVLNGAVDPRGAATTYYFQYGPTVSYGSQTTPASLPAGTARVKVGQAVTGLLTGYHYRIVASNGVGSPAAGDDRTYTAAASSTGKPVLSKPSAPIVFGSVVTLSGSISGTGNANRQVVLESSSPYPYLAPFTDVGAPTATNAAGLFSFRVASLSASTQFRVSTVSPQPLYSTVVTQDVTPLVTLKVRSTSRKGLVRLYGTVTPAEVGARVDFQLRKAVRPGKSEKTTTFATQFSTVVKRGTKAVSRFSAVVDVLHGGRYRAFVQVPKGGALVAGSSEQTVVLSAAPSKKPKRKKN